MTDEKGLDDQLCSKVVTAYIGFDLTAPSLHVGSLVQIMLLRHLQKCGHRPIVLMGGGTTKIGDPSGKDESRKMLDNATIDANKASIFKTFERFLTFGDGPTDAIMVDNADWLEGLSYIDFLRDVGPHFTINRMMTFDSVKLRLDREQPLTFLEFNYMILQAYDFMELARNFDCTLQLGGSDQWGNIVNGMELARRMDSRSTFGLTSPLITTADGGKMGKTAAGAVWLNEEQLSNHDYWQFWRNTQDADVGKFLRLFTELPLDEIERLEGLQGAALNDAKKILANKATTLCRGAEAAKRASESATTLFDEGGIDKSQTHDNGWFTDELLESGTIKILDVLVDNELCKSKKEARRLIEQGGARINNIPITDVSKILSIEDFNGQAALRLSAGKKRHTTLSRMPEITS
jgi:tyrosyl-tRNA synthetase